MARFPAKHHPLDRKTVGGVQKKAAARRGKHAFRGQNTAVRSGSGPSIRATDSGGARCPFYNAAGQKCVKSRHSEGRHKYS